MNINNIFSQIDFSKNLFEPQQAQEKMPTSNIPIPIGVPVSPSSNSTSFVVQKLECTSETKSEPIIHEVPSLVDPDHQIFFRFQQAIKDNPNWYSSQITKYIWKVCSIPERRVKNIIQEWSTSSNEAHQKAFEQYQLLRRKNRHTPKFVPKSGQNSQLDKDEKSRQMKYFQEFQKVLGENPRWTVIQASAHVLQKFGLSEYYIRKLIAGWKSSPDQEIALFMQEIATRHAKSAPPAITSSDPISSGNLKLTTHQKFEILKELVSENPSLSNTKILDHFRKKIKISSLSYLSEVVKWDLANPEIYEFLTFFISRGNSSFRKNWSNYLGIQEPLPLVKRGRFSELTKGPDLKSSPPKPQLSVVEVEDSEPLPELFDL